MTDEERDPPAPPPADRDDHSETVCEHCGASIDTSDWYPVTKERDADETLQFYAFCGERCRDAWLDGHRD